MSFGGFSGDISGLFDSPRFACLSIHSMTRQSYMCPPCTPPLPPCVCVCVCGRKSLLIANRVEKWIFHRISILWLKFIHEALIRKSSTDVRSRFRLLHPRLLLIHFSPHFFGKGCFRPTSPLFRFLITATFSVTFSFWACYELSQHILQHLPAAYRGMGRDSQREKIVF